MCEREAYKAVISDFKTHPDFKHLFDTHYACFEGKSGHYSISGNAKVSLERLRVFFLTEKKAAAAVLANASFSLEGVSVLTCLHVRVHNATS